MEKLVSLANKLQDIFTLSGCTKINLPQIVVVGSQSSGKSSILEHLVGRSFLPKGSGLQTRCPVILQMAKTESDEYGVFQHNLNKIYNDYSEITEEIVNETNRLAGNDKGIVNQPIVLKLYSRHFIDLTLVDLPGITKIPIGDQPDDIEEQTKGLIKEYIENPSTIILAVTAANVDMATSESLKLAKEVDPDGKRTLAVVTKLDLMDEGTNAIEMLSGKFIPVKLGIIGVVNRSQKNVDLGQSIDDSLAEEANFLKKNYKSIASVNGTPYLKNSVQKILIKHIQECIPKLKESIDDQLSICNTELLTFSEKIDDKKTLLLELLKNFCRKFDSELEGSVPDKKSEALCGGANICNMLLQDFTSSLSEFTALDGVSAEYICKAIQSATGVKPAIIPEIAFERLVKEEIKRLREPCLNCVDSVHAELISVVNTCLQDEETILSRFPKLKSEICDFASSLLGKRVPITKEMINNTIDVHLGYINKTHPDFLHNFKLQNETQGKNIPVGSDFLTKDGRKITDADCNVVRLLVETYFSMVKKSLEDIIPKVIMHFLVNYTQERLEVLMINQLWVDEAANDCFEESSAVKEKRDQLEMDVAALTEAKKILKREVFY